MRVRVLRPPSVSAIVVVAIALVAVAFASTHAAADPVYFGAAARGGLPPDVVTSFRASLERAMAKKGIKVLDASSVAEDAAKKELADAKAALDEGTTAFNDNDYEGAVASAQSALKLFESGPAFTDDDNAWALYRDILSLRALADLKLKKKRDADEALRALLVVLPRYAPNREKAPPELVRHVDDVKDELRSLPPTTIEVSSKPAGARVTVDGKARGRSPLLVEDLAPGVHYVAVEAGGGRYVERVVVGDEGGKIDARLGSKKGAAAHDVIAALSKPTTAKVFVQSITEVDDDVLVAVLLPEGKKVEMIAGRVVGGEVRVVVGTRVKADVENAREKAAYDLAEALLTRRDDAWVDVKDDPSSLRPKLFSSLGTTAIPDVDPDEPPPETPPAVIAAGVIGAVAGLAIVGTGVGFLIAHEVQSGQGFSFDIDTKGLKPPTPPQ